MIDETIDEVLSGKGTISFSCTSPKGVLTPPPPPTPKQNKVPLSCQIVFEPNESLTTVKSCMSPVNQKPPPSVEDPSIFTFHELNPIQLNTPRIHSNSIDSIKLSESSPIHSSERQTSSPEITILQRKRPSNFKLKIQPETPACSISTEDLPSTSTSPIPITPTVNDKPASWTDTPIPSSSENASIISTEHFDQHPVADSSVVPDTNSKDPIIKEGKLDDEQPQVIHPNDEPHGIDFNEHFPLEINNLFVPSTSPRLAPSSSSEIISSSTMNQPLPTLPNERSSISLLPCKTENTYIYDHFVPNFSSSSFLREDNSAATSSTPRSNHSFDQKPYPVVDAYFQDDCQSQVRMFSDLHKHCL